MTILVAILGPLSLFALAGLSSGYIWRDARRRRVYYGHYVVNPWPFIVANILVAAAGAAAMLNALLS